jgi:hypothetical protein
LRNRDELPGGRSESTGSLYAKAELDRSGKPQYGELAREDLDGSIATAATDSASQSRHERCGWCSGRKVIHETAEALRGGREVRK